MTRKNPQPPKPRTSIPLAAATAKISSKIKERRLAEESRVERLRAKADLKDLRQLVCKRILSARDGGCDSVQLIPDDHVRVLSCETVVNELKAAGYAATSGRGYIGYGYMINISWANLQPTKEKV